MFGLNLALISNCKWSNVTFLMLQIQLFLKFWVCLGHFILMQMFSLFSMQKTARHRAQWWCLRIQSENLHKDERSYQWEVSLLNYTFQWIQTKLKNVVDIRSLGWLLKRSIFQHVNSSLSTWLYLTLSPVSILPAEIGNLCHTVSASPEGQ